MNHAIGPDAIAIRDYVQTAEGSGFDYMLTIDHIIGVHPDRFGPSGPPFNYTHETPTHEMFTLFAYLAGVTNRLEFIIIASLSYHPRLEREAIPSSSVEYPSG